MSSGSSTGYGGGTVGGGSGMSSGSSTGYGGGTVGGGGGMSSGSSTGSGSQSYGYPSGSGKANAGTDNGVVGYQQAVSAVKGFLDSKPAQAVRNVIDSLQNTKVGGTLIGALGTAARSVTVAGRTYSETIAVSSRPTVEAMMAGLEAQKQIAYENSKLASFNSNQRPVNEASERIMNEPRFSSNPVAINQAAQRGYYAAVSSYYQSSHIPIDRQFVAQGPFADITKNIPNLPEDVKASIKQLDAFYKEGAFDVHLPGGYIAGRNISTLAIGAYTEMTMVQQVAIRNTTIVDIEFSRFGVYVENLLGIIPGSSINTYGVTSSNNIVGSIAFIDSSSPPPEKQSTIYHEITHTGDKMVEMALERAIGTAISPDDVRHHLATLEAVRASRAYNYDEKRMMTMGDLSPALRQMVNDPYYDSIKESRAYAHQKDDVQWATGLMISENVTAKEAFQMIDAYRADPVFQELDRIMNDTAAKMLEGKL